MIYDPAAPPPPAPPPPAPTKRQFYADPGRKPPVLRVNPPGVPRAMQDERRWVGWRLEWKTRATGEGVWNKCPKTAGGRNASSTDPTTWLDFAAAVGLLAAGCDGIGFVLGSGFVGIDLDDVREATTGRLTAGWTGELVGELTAGGGEADVSPSGTGVKVFGRGKWANTWNKRRHPSGIGEIEVYDGGRYFCVTGRPVSAAGGGVGDIQPALDRLAGLFPTATQTAPARSSQLPAGGLVPLARREERGPRQPGDPWIPPADDDELLRMILLSKNGAKFEALWTGRWLGYFGSQSEADLSLAGMLGWWTAGDAARADRLFRRSALMRDKWDAKRGQQTYGERTISRVSGGVSGG